MNVTPINAKKASFDIATEVLWQNRWDSRAEALRITIGTLVNDYGIAEATAEVAAIQAFAALDSVNLDSTIDLTASTSHVVVLRTRNGYPVVFTARDLDRMIQQARDAGLAQVVDADTRRPVVLEH
ncbi:hypothetical protein SAMN04487867_10841 [Vreelandella titanicae]|uniref:hypothetical protein n=1 Tax=Vreelandella titanicae TaxID=664683 RepID=UPI000889A76A|nr:hypothetical protein [Halomonas titanicae]SDI51447.1 hypothetical protein SAMN04487867_10841 [Halomonas titanicae]